VATMSSKGTVWKSFQPSASSWYSLPVPSGITW
jgi:hypothetical protein